LEENPILIRKLNKSTVPQADIETTCETGAFLFDRATGFSRFCLDSTIGRDNTVFRGMITSEDQNGLSRYRRSFLLTHSMSPAGSEVAPWSGSATIP
jgi:hypothetical protein